MGNEGCRWLSKVLQFNNLIWLNLSISYDRADGNRIGPKGCEDLIKANWNQLREAILGTYDLSMQTTITSGHKGAGSWPRTDGQSSKPSI